MKTSTNVNSSHNRYGLWVLLVNYNTFIADHKYIEFQLRRRLKFVVQKRIYVAHLSLSDHIVLGVNYSSRKVSR